MRLFRFRDHSWRFYRNWLVASAVWLVFFVALFQLAHSLINLVWAIPFFLIGETVIQAYRHTHPVFRFRTHNLTPADVGLAYQQVEFPSRDGLTLFGWYVPGGRRAVVILVHGFGSDGLSMIYHASTLAAHGYGVLMFDLRAHGSSDGDTCSGGPDEVNDLLGAVDHVSGREDVDRRRIGALGISLGGHIALRAAARSQAIGAVVAEGPSSGSLRDRGRRPLSLWRWLNTPLDWLFFATRAWMSGVKPDHGLLDDLSAIAPRPMLLISAGKGVEQKLARRFYEAAGEPRALWEVPEARHGGAYFARPTEYTQRIHAFFDAALFGRESDLPPTS